MGEGQVSGPWQEYAQTAEKLPWEEYAEGPALHTYEAGGKRFQLPENASDEEVRAMAVKVAGGKYSRSAVNRGSRVSPPLPQEDSALRGLIAGALMPLDNAAEFVAAIPGVEAVSNAISEATGLPTVDEQVTANEAARAGNSRTGYQLLGNVAGTAPLAALPGGVLAQGAAGGALLSEADTPGGIAMDAGIGAVAGRVGQAAVNGVANLVAPVVNPLVRRLIDAGVPLTPGQIVGQGGWGGRAVKRLEDSVSNLPLIGTAIRGARVRGDDALNRAAVQRALAPIGERLPDNIQTGNDAVAHAGNRLSEAYNRILPQLSGQMDQTFANRVTAIQRRAALPPTYQRQVQDVMDEVQRAFTQTPGQPAGRFSGRSLRDASDRLDKLATGWRTNPNDPYLRQVGEVAGQLREQLHALARRQNPRAARELRAIDRGYASLVRTERAATAAPSEGVFTPKGYQTAVRGADRSTRRRAVARGEALDQDLADAAARVMPSTVGEGGSNAVNGLAMLGALGTGAAYGSPGAMGLIGATTAGSLAYTVPGQRAAEWLLARQVRPAEQYIGNLLRRGAPLAALPATAGATGTIQPLLNR
jgi:hypothetical protein